jgi:hypothetical protein
MRSALNDGCVHFTRLRRPGWRAVGSPGRPRPNGLPIVYHRVEAPAIQSAIGFMWRRTARWSQMVRTRQHEQACRLQVGAGPQVTEQRCWLRLPRQSTIIRRRPMSWLHSWLHLRAGPCGLRDRPGLCRFRLRLSGTGHDQRQLIRHRWCLSGLVHRRCCSGCCFPQRTRRSAGLAVSEDDEVLAG